MPKRGLPRFHHVGGVTSFLPFFFYILDEIFLFFYKLSLKIKLLLSIPITSLSFDKYLPSKFFVLTIFIFFLAYGSPVKIRHNRHLV